MFVNIVSGVTWYSCYKKYTEGKLIASVIGICKPLPRGAKTLDQTCLGEQLLFLNVHFVSGVTVSGVTILKGNPTDRMVTPLTFDRSYRCILDRRVWQR